MQKMKIKKIILIMFAILSISTISMATNEEILDSQSDKLNIKKFVDEANSYTKDSFGDLDINELLNNALKGDINNKSIVEKIMSLFGSEIGQTLKIMGSIIVIVIIHSILKSVSDSLENKSISQIAYYVQYILIVTIIMSNFGSLITMTKQSIQDLVAFSSSLIPILITLLVTTGSMVSASVIQPVLLYLITFIGNIINVIFLPLILVGTALSIISKISDKVQIDKLAKYFRSSVIWAIGVVLTVFVGVLSLEGTLSSSVDRFNRKNYQGCNIEFCSCSWKNIRRCS